MRFSFFICALLCFWANRSPSVAAAPKPPRYDITDLGALHKPFEAMRFYPGSHEGAWAINDRGQILLNIGDFRMIEGNSRAGHDVLWERGGVTDLNHLGPVGKSNAAAINDLGQILINAETGETYKVAWDTQRRHVSRPYFYSAGTLKTLEMPFYALSVTGTVLNNRGEVIGQYIGRDITTFSGFGESDSIFGVGGPLFWSASGTPFRLNGIDKFSDPRIEAAGFINDRGDILGAYSPVERRTDLGLINVSVPLGGNYRLNGFNNEGQIIGDWGLPGAYDGNGVLTIYHAFRADNTGTKMLKSNRKSLTMKITDLGVLPGDRESTASAINGKGQIVGWSQNFTSHFYVTFNPGKSLTLAALQTQKSKARKQTERKSRAFLWQDGKMHDLHSLTRHGSDWTFSNATGINNRGQIIGNGFWKGELHAFLLTPH